MTDFTEYYSGDRLYGDDFSPARISEWLKEEEGGYYDLTIKSEVNPQDEYGYSALNYMHGYSLLRGMSFQKCLGLGIAGGQDIRPIASRVDSFYCVEPGRAWWSPELFGKPATFAMPNVGGEIDLPNESCDISVSFGVLHHIPNVTAVLTEVCRVLRPGGLLLLREPIVTMGEWGKPRRGLTKNERGLPLAWLRQTTQTLGFEVVNEQLCGFRPFILAMARAFRLNVYASKTLTRMDALLCDVTAFNARYYRPSLLGKFAPSSVFAVYRKGPTP